ncbi:MAG: leucine-rich repeat domain-containing protein [Bacilli bacterium]|nr:leucine-rich repeat domain-containing protein [Bacilli bacterium]
MKIKFAELPDIEGQIQISFDGGVTFNGYNTSEVISDGILLDEDQDLDKIQIKGNSSILKNIRVVGSVYVEQPDGSISGNFIFNLSKSKDFPKCIIFYEIPKGITSIGNGAFQGYSFLEKVDIPEEVTNIGNSAFTNCTSLKNIILPENVTNIGSQAFYNCSNLTSITIPNEVSTIRGSTFANCTSLTSIIIPSNITNIESQAFYNCKVLKTINYKGTEEQWNSITKASNWKQGCPYDMVVNYNYQD